MSQTFDQDWGKNIMEENDMKKDVGSMYMDELTEYITSLGFPKFRAKQVFEWIHKKYAMNVEEMTNLPKDLKEEIGKELITVKEETRQTSAKDGTIKFLFRMEDGQMIESVFMRYHHGNSICISSQAGCAMGCKFCASTIGGKIRNLTPSEMLGQIYLTMKLTGERISNIVVMGTGEPLDNYDNLIRFLKLISNEQGYNISLRNITVSSCGLVPKIKMLADEGLPITFALSLHATTDEERKNLMPVAERYTIKETLDACRYYFDKTGRRVTFEYSLVRGVNDSEQHAMRLSKLLSDMHGHVNLIPINAVAETEFSGSTRESAERFKNTLEKKSINVTIRRGMGSDIDAACGQLRLKHAKD